jgi:hypothetical protein
VGVSDVRLTPDSGHGERFGKVAFWLQKFVLELLRWFLIWNWEPVPAQ